MNRTDMASFGRYIMRKDRHVERGGRSCGYRKGHSVSPVAFEKEDEGNEQEHSGDTKTERW